MAKFIIRLSESEYYQQELWLFISRSSAKDNEHHYRMAWFGYGSDRPEGNAEKLTRKEAIAEILRNCGILEMDPECPAIEEFPELREISAAVRAAVEKIP